MKNKRASAAKRASKHRFARNVLRDFEKGFFYLQAAYTFAENSAERDHAMERAKSCWFGFAIMLQLGAATHCDGDLAKFLRVIAEASEGKFSGGTRDAMIAEACDRAVWNGKRKDEREAREHPLSREILDEIAGPDLRILLFPGERPTLSERTLPRRLRAMGRDWTKKPGRPFGKRNAGTAATKKSPLTAQEKMKIRELEWSIPKAQIEREIGKRFQRTDDGDYVAVDITQKNYHGIQSWTAKSRGKKIAR